MKPQKAYPAIDRSADRGKTNMRLINTQVIRKKSSRRINNDALFTLRVNDRKLEELIRNSIRNIIIEEFSYGANENNKHPNEFSLNAKESLPVLMLNNYRKLTAREIEVMDLVLLDFINRKIAARLNMKLSTVKNHIKSINNKLGVKDRKTACIVYRKLYNKPELVPK